MQAGRYTQLFESIPISADLGTYLILQKGPVELKGAKTHRYLKQF